MNEVFPAPVGPRMLQELISEGLRGDSKRSPDEDITLLGGAHWESDQEG